MRAALEELRASSTPTECVSLGDTDCHSCGGGFVLCRKCWEELKAEIDRLYKG